jgi:hypothetical protein
MGAAAAYPAGEHMAFTSLAGALQEPAEDFFRAHGADPSAGDGRLRHAGLGRLAAGGGGLDSHSVVLGYPVALLPLPAFLCAVAMGLMALVELVRGKPLDLGHGAEVE